jgi:hypothetical protein
VTPLAAGQFGGNLPGNFRDALYRRVDEDHGLFHDDLVGGRCGGRSGASSR